MQGVLHAVDQFLPRSETFVYTVVTAHRRFEASVVCNERANAEEFPFARIHEHRRPRSRRTAEWWLDQSIGRATGRSRWQRGVEMIIDRLEPAVVHAHFGPNGCAMVPVTKAIGVPLVTSLYGVDAAVLPYLPHWRDQYARLFRDGDLFLAEGPEMRKKVIAAGAPAERTIIHPIALDLSKYPTWNPAPEPTVLFVGRFMEKKGLLDAIVAFGRAHARVPGSRFVVVGGGPEDEKARALVDTLHLGAVVEFAGMQPHADVIRRLAGAAVLIHPSVTAGDGDSEGGAPTILLEAQAIGTPIVTTRHADIPHVVPAGAGVTLCAERDVDALGDALVGALLGPVGSSSAHVAHHHDVRQVIERLEDLYLLAAERLAPTPARGGA